MIDVTVVVIEPGISPQKGAVNPNSSFGEIKEDILAALSSKHNLGPAEDWVIAISPHEASVSPDRYRPANGDILYLLRVRALPRDAAWVPEDSKK